MKMNVLVACHNRAPLTVQSIKGMLAAAQAAGVDVSFTVFDDGSTDGTAELLSELPADLRLLRGDGTAFWARGMAAAEEALTSANRLDDSDYVLWLNDDVILDVDAVQRLADCASSQPGSVVVGAMRSPDSGSVSYSGLRRSGMHPLRFQRVEASDTLQEVATFNGNLVLVPATVVRHLGGIDGGFAHGLADIDYGLRCSRAGVRVIQAPGTYGTCGRNSTAPSMSIQREWAHFTGPKGGGNFTSLQRILHKEYKNSWIFYIAITYVLWWMRQLGKRMKRRVAQL